MFAPRTRDYIYLIFLLIHIPATLLVDLQALFFAKDLAPTALRKIFEFAAKDDPLLSNANNYPSFAWFQSFIILEAVFQLPVFFIGARAIWRDQKTLYPLLSLYGISSATTTWACLFTVLTTPNISHQLPKLLASYVPFLLIPLAMGVDYAIRLSWLVGEREKERKRE
ncbi:transmembrane protein 6/97 [Leucosporidium creatinivorum]|uniref:Efficient mitochondria targeting-associated protein 19 n=1 Tax=Leucosporidium creatinivorum TaxID=106004 RepID=A0A1Y2FVJ5_9BASI|nr:transmembrane protein 6/97 [Leucosporidium creatinivorum]